MEQDLNCDRCGQKARRFLAVSKQIDDRRCLERRVIVTECSSCDSLAIVCAGQWALLVPPWPGMVLSRQSQYF